MSRRKLSLIVLLGIAAAQIIGFNVYAINKSKTYDIPKTVKVQIVVVDMGNHNSSIDVDSIPFCEPEKPEFIPYDVSLSPEIQEYIYKKCLETDIPIELVMAIIECESNFTVDDISKTNDYGLMQVNKANHKWLSKELGITDFLDPIQNIDAGMYVLNDLFSKEIDLHKVLMMYNCGPTGAKKLWDKGIYSTKYSQKVIEKMSEFERS